MKKSEFIGKAVSAMRDGEVREAFLRGEGYANAARVAAERAEAAGVVWDPEVPPKPELPARLLRSGELLMWQDENKRIVLDLTLCNPTGDESRFIRMKARELAILDACIRAYNLLPAIRQRIDYHLSGKEAATCIDFARQLGRWIDGTEEPPQ